jgi:hypothetical protein
MLSSQNWCQHLWQLLEIYLHPRIIVYYCTIIKISYILKFIGDKFISDLYIRFGNTCLSCSIIKPAIQRFKRAVMTHRIDSRLVILRSQVRVQPLQCYHWGIGSLNHNWIPGRMRRLCNWLVRSTSCMLPGELMCMLDWSQSKSG